MSMGNSAFKLSRLNPSVPVCGSSAYLHVVRRTGGHANTGGLEDGLGEASDEVVTNGVQGRFAAVCQVEQAGTDPYVARTVPH